MLSSASPRLSHLATGGQHRTAQALALLRRHWLLAVLLVAGLVLRALTQFAYQPALVYIDTLKYLYGVYPGSDPLGYRVLLKVFLTVGDLGFVAAVQHLLGLAMAVALYAVLLRRGVWRWLAALAAAPVLLDAYQLQMEQMIMPDVWFEALLVAGLVLLLWSPVVTTRFAVLAGVVLGASATFKSLGQVLILPAVAYLVVSGLQGPGAGWRRALTSSATLAAAFVLPILLYCGASAAITGHFWLAHGQPNSGRMAAAADCATLKLPPAVRPLCPTPAEQAQGPDWLEHSGKSPLHAAPLPPGISRAEAIAALSSAVQHQQPGRVVVSIARDAVRLFALTRDQAPGIVPVSRWQFQTSYPVYPPWVTVSPRHVIVAGLQWRVFGPFRPTPLRPSYGGHAQVNVDLARFLRSYQLNGGFTPGPLLLLVTLAGLAGTVLALMGLGRTRRSSGPGSRPLALGSLLFTATAVVVLLAPDVLEFSWRYQLPAVVTLPPAGVLGICAIVSRYRARGQSRGERVIEASDVAWSPPAAS
ncbi:MAG TPA: hypothetical protein VH480_13315 [Streptosporangiaceae bacterium]|jgi:hypothetical protein